MGRSPIGDAPAASAAGADPPQDDYWQLDAVLRLASAELWGLFCFERGALGAELLEEGPARHVVRHYFAAAPEAEAWAAAFRRAYPHLPAPERLTVRHLPAQAWATAWHAHFSPLRLGRRLLIVPPWETPPADPGGVLVADDTDDTDDADDRERVRIVIEPGQGFGTGWHPSTAAALLALEQALAEWPAPEHPPARPAGAPAPAGLLDVGTGSGILAIAGRLLGVPRALALDVDPVALPEVRRNAALSGLAPPLVVQGRPDCLRGAFPLIVANIVAEVLLAQHEQLAALTAPGGCLILSGLLHAERDALRDAYAAHGLRLEHEQPREGWLALTLRRG